MKLAITCLFALVAIASAFPNPLHKPATSEEIVAHLNAQNLPWKAEVSPRFVGHTLEHVSELCGTYMPGEELYRRLPEKVYEATNLGLPVNFDTRQAFPQCASVIGHIRDQSSCGSCWAFGSTEAFNDRYCIATGNTTLLSVEDTTACCNFIECFSMGCGGGQVGAPWAYFVKHGIVTGGDYDDMGKSDTCQPYSLPPCAHHVAPTPEIPACPSSDYSTPACKKSCTNPYALSFQADVHHAKSSYSISGRENIKAEIMKGPVTAAFTVYSDFPNYKSGVYVKTEHSGRALGGHAIKIIGWGHDEASGLDYWLVNNSWNRFWGDNGTFKIAMGSCGIEGNVAAGDV